VDGRGLFSSTQARSPLRLTAVGTAGCSPLKGAPGSAVPREGLAELRHLADPRHLPGQWPDASTSRIISSATVRCSLVVQKISGRW